MKEGLIKDTYEAIAKELQLVLSMAYLLMVGIGMLFNYQKYSEFGINIFQYADVFDFLIAPFEDWRIFAFSIASSLIPVFLFMIDRAWQRKGPKSYSLFAFGMDKKSWYNSSRFIAIGLLFIFYTYTFANSYGEKAKERILASDDITIRFADDEVVMGKEIGKTDDVFFLLREDQVRIIPFNSLVKWIEP